MFIFKNISENDNKEVLELGKILFREEDDFPILEKAMTSYVRELSYVIINKGNNIEKNENNKIIGFIVVCKKMTKIYDKFITKVPNCYELSFFGIHPKYQGKGLGSQCFNITLSSIYKICNQFNCWLIVDIDNKNAIKLYKKFGFRHWKTIDHDKYPSYIMGLSYRRWITLNTSK
jgi:ribosomal protein S18 acetylase RimI-like enzyme